MEIDPKLIPQVERYKLLIGLVVPRPIALVSTVSRAGELNLAPFSFFAGVGSNPMTVLFCPANKEDGTEKDSLRNAKDVSEGGSGEFVVNIVDDAIARQTAGSAEPLAYGQSEFALTGLTPVGGRVVKCARVLESPASFECVTRQVIRTNPGGAASGNVVIGEVVHIHVRDDLINERLHVDPAKLAAVGRMGGTGYIRTAGHDQRFEMPQGGKALEQG